MFNGRFWQGSMTAAAVAFLFSATAQAALVVAMPPLADGHVRSGSDRKNFGFEPQIELKTGTLSGASEGYFTFPLAHDASFSEKVVLRLHAQLADPGSAKVLVRSVANTNWTELGLTWRTRPEHKETLGTLNVVGLSGAWYELDVTAYVQAEANAGKSAVSFAIVPADDRTRITVQTRESSVKKPELAFVRSAISAQISFCPTNAVPPEGYFADNGEVFGRRANGFTYGWNADIREFMRNRAENKYKKDKPVKTPDTRYDFLAYMDNEKMKAPAFWEMAVPQGAYKVRVVAGDSTKYDSIYGLTAEGVTVIEGIPDAQKRWFDSTVTVNVTDGRLTIANAPGSSNNKISFIEINEVENLLTQTTPGQ